ncbi:hypothetical protein [Nocardioides sp. CFH 31398]|uniref:hypothetical protein n=1 Tax=Nocardioides sp. CFH 31398 TaxID=2919579 RepID=UPI001F05C8B1|nr:hypothetical protein [Nocardioides sp. CFH 31398]MCH1867160.1 hypothetical protein [Nocardioides sp. CFH 31398]
MTQPTAVTVAPLADVDGRPAGFAALARGHLPGVTHFHDDDRDASAAVAAWGLAVAARHSESLLDLTTADRDELERLYTQDMEGDEPILAANRRLGFVRGSGYCEVPVSLGRARGSAPHAQS